MVNYLDDPGSIEANHERFANTGRAVRSAEVDALPAAGMPGQGGGQSRVTG